MSLVPRLAQGLVLTLHPQTVQVISDPNKRAELGEDSHAL